MSDDHNSEEASKARNWRVHVSSVEVSHLNIKGTFRRIYKVTEPGPERSEEIHVIAAEALERLPKTRRPIHAAPTEAPLEMAPSGFDEFLLGIVAGRDRSDAVLGDEEERFHRNISGGMSRARARLRYWISIVHLTAPALKRLVKTAWNGGLRKLRWK